MGHAQWTVVASSDERRSAALRTTDEFAPLRAFFWEAPDASYPEMIRAARDGVGRGFDGAGVTFAGDLDEADKDDLEPDQVEVYDPMAQIVLARTEFLRALLEVGRMVLQVRRQRGTADADWEREMTDELAALEAHLQS